MDSIINSVLNDVRNELDLLFSASAVDEGHGIAHANTVERHVHNALQVENCTQIDWKRCLALKLAALLHDADDSKFFNTTDYSNARRIAKDALDKILRLEASNAIVEEVIEMIKLVSCSTNLNTPPADGQMWKLLPRYADRLEAMGHIGIFRAYKYSTFKDRPMFVDSTPVNYKTVDEVIVNINDERFQNYAVIRKSESFIDHFFDKVLHLVRLTDVCDNAYINRIAKVRHDVMLEFLAEFGRTKVINGEEICNRRLADVVASNADVVASNADVVASNDNSNT